MVRFAMAFAVAAVGLLASACTAAPGGAAASNDSEAMTTGQFAVDSSKQLPDCTPDFEAYIAFLRDEGREVKCTSGNWVTTTSESN